jgi:hypothetical protein
MTNEGSSKAQSPLTAHAAPKSKRGKNDQIVSGCRKLAAAQAPGQCFTVSEIGRACGVCDRSITFIERRARYNFLKRLAALCPEVVDELDLFKGRPLKEIFLVVKADPYRTGNPPVRPKTASKSKTKSEAPAMYKVARELDRQGSHKRWTSLTGEEARRELAGMLLPAPSCEAA